MSIRMWWAPVESPGGPEKADIEKRVLGNLHDPDDGIVQNIAHEDFHADGAGDPDQKQDRHTGHESLDPVDDPQQSRHEVPQDDGSSCCCSRRVPE